MEPIYFTFLGLLLGFAFDQIFGDPKRLPHLIVGFGNLISFGEKRMNKGRYLLVKGAFLTLTLVVSVYLLSYFVFYKIIIDSDVLNLIFTVVIVFFCLSARTLRDEVKQVFLRVESSVGEGREQLSRIVGRDTDKLNPQQIRSAALETLAENLSDGVIAPLFWFAILGPPGILAYKMINTLDSMIAYKNDRYLYFGRFAARLDDVANYIPARLTAFIMLLVSTELSKMPFVLKFGKNHTSPNSGYPEAALAGILDCQFGGTSSYFGEDIEKPFIGINKKIFDNNDLEISLTVNQFSEMLMLMLVVLFMYFFK